ncbi:MAG: hypothetical protein N2C13_05735, partial [Chloroflexota bacterium]
MKPSPDFENSIRILEAYEDMELVEKLMLTIWAGTELDVIPAHVLVTTARNGGLVLASYNGEEMNGMLFGFVGMTARLNRPKFKHCSHILGVLEDERSSGIGFKLKRAQWQMVRNQGLELATWTFDPLLSRNAYLNISKLGAVCNLYKRDDYGDMRDALNAGLGSD